MRPAKRTRAGWLHAPQRVWLRRAIFQIHLWLGLILAAYSVVIGLTGATLIFNDEIQEAVYSRELHIEPSARQTTFAAILSSVEAARPGWRAAGITDIGEGATTRGYDTKPILITMRRLSNLKSTDLRYVYVDPNTGRVLQDRMRYSDFMGFVFHLHLYLLLDRIGLTISGWMALGLLILCISGIVVWWPGVSRWAASIVLRRRSSWRRFNWDLHSVTGFWCCAALTAVSLTGVYFAFPLYVAGPIVKLTGGNLKEAVKYVTQPKALPFKPGTPMITPDQALQAINANMEDAPPSFYLQLPQTEKDIYGGISYYPNLTQYTAARRVAVDPHTGAVLMALDTRKAPLGVRLVQYFYSIHFGTFAGTKGVIAYIVRGIWVLLGISPALLAITGLVMYWNRKLRAPWQRLRSMRRGA
jgi:uncharacterized iron-regulated membrane protein